MTGHTYYLVVVVLLVTVLEAVRFVLLESNTVHTVNSGGKLSIYFVVIVRVQIRVQCKCIIKVSSDEMCITRYK